MDNSIQDVEEQIRKVESEILAVTDELARAPDKDVNYLRTKEERLRKEKEQLRTKEEQLREEKLIALRAAAGSAAAFGLGSTGGASAAQATAPKGPPRKFLLDEAPRLQPHSHAPAADGAAAAAAAGSGSATVWEICDRDGRKSGRLYLDTWGVVQLIKKWVTHRFNKAGDTTLSSGLSPLILNGLIKTGKSYTLQEVVPAVVSEVLQEQGPNCLLSGITVLRLNGAALNREEGVAALLHDLLNYLMKWAVDMNVPVEEAAWQHAQQVRAALVSSMSMHIANAAVTDFFKAVKVPVLVLFDEVQSFFQPTVNGQLDQTGAAYIRNVTLKQLLGCSPNNVLWCVTGSGMALTWMSIAAMPTNGFTLWTKAKQVDLPATYPQDDIELLWNHLVRKGDPDLRLLEWSERSPALLTSLVEEWENQCRPTDIDEFAADFLYTKLVTEAEKEWKLGLAGLSDAQRSVVLDLAFAGVGIKIDILDRGFKRFLMPYLQRAEKGLYYFKDGYQAQLLRMVINKDGTLRSREDDLQCSATLAQLDLGWRLLRLGEVADYLFGARAKSRWEDKPLPVGSDVLKRELEALADLAVERLPKGDSVSSRWEQLASFKAVLESEYNSGDRSWYGKNKVQLETPLDYLVFFFRLSRNMLAHQKPWDGEDLVNVDVVMALPRLLGQRVSDVSEIAFRAMGKLSSSAVLEVIHEAEKQDTSTGGDISGLGGGGGRKGGKGDLSGVRKGGGHKGYPSGVRKSGGRKGRSGGARAVGGSADSLSCSIKHTTANGSAAASGYGAVLLSRPLHFSGPWTGRVPGRTVAPAYRPVLQRVSFPRAAFLPK